MGENIYLASGQESLEVVGHEVAHVLQQRHGRLRRETEAELEREAVEAGRAVAAGRRPKRGAGTGRPLHGVQHYTLVNQAARAGHAGGVAVVNGLRTPGGPFTTDSFVGQDKPGYQASSFLTAANGGPQLSSANPANVPLRVSASGKMAIEAADLATRQPKVFYATQDVIDESNLRLILFGSQFRLVRDAAGPNQRRITVGAHTLFRVLPHSPSLHAGGLTMQATQSCNGLVDNVIGSTAAMRFGTLDAPAHVLREFHVARALLPNPKPALIDDTSAATVGATVRAIGVAYGALLRAPTPAFTNLLQQNHLNAYADPAVGEGFLTTTLIFPAQGQPLPPGPAVVEDHSVFVGGQPRGIHQPRMWNTHWGGVVASDGHDVVTFENYARNVEDHLDTNDTRWYFQMYSLGTPGSWHEAWTNVPMTPVVGVPPAPGVTHLPTGPGERSFATPMTMRVTGPDNRFSTYAVQQHANVDAVKNDHGLVAGALTADAELTEVLKGLRYADAHLAAGQAGDRARVGAWRNAIAAAILADAWPINRQALAFTQVQLNTMDRHLI